MRYINLVSFLLFSVIGFSQNLYDAINYSFEEEIGNARFLSMGNSFGALGGNLSAISKVIVLMVAAATNIAQKMITARRIKSVISR